MIRVRRFEEACAEMYAKGRIRGFLHLGVGQEACAVGTLRALTPRDAVVAHYREHAHALVRGMPMQTALAEMFGFSEGCSMGRGGSMHLFDRDLRLFGGNAIVAAGMPTAAGVALADVLRDDRNVTACFFGDGAAAEGAFHESLNLAALWHLPVLFICENNGYAMGTAVDRALAGTGIAQSAERYGITATALDGMDVEVVVVAADHAVAQVRFDRGSGLAGAADLPVPGPLDVRPTAVPHAGRGRRASAPRSTRAAGDAAHRGGAG